MENTGRLVKYGLLITLLSWLLYTAYWAAKLTVSLPDIFAVPNPWAPLYFSSTLGVAFLFVGLVARTIGSAFAVYAAVRFFRKGWSSFVRNIVIGVVVLEAVYLFSILPTAWIGIDVSDPILLPEATIPSLFEGILVPLSLLMLAVRLRWPGKAGTTAKWACISGVMYIMALFVRFTMQWIATFVQTEKYTTFFGGFPAYGVSYIANYPLNMMTFIVTVIGLPLLIMYALGLTFDVGASSPEKVWSKENLRKLGLALTLVGVYFAVCLFPLYALPAYVGDKSIWASFFTGHNIDLWMLALPIVGVPMMLNSTTAEKIESKKETEPA